MAYFANVSVTPRATTGLAYSISKPALQQAFEVASICANASAKSAN